MGVLSSDGYGRSFDEDASGYCRADGIVSLFLQKSKDAKRIYAKFIHSKKNVDGFKREGLAFPSRVMKIKLFDDFYKEIGINPNLIDYVEAHSTGTKVGLNCYHFIVLKPYFWVALGRRPRGMCSS